MVFWQLLATFRTVLGWELRAFVSSFSSKKGFPVRNVSFQVPRRGAGGGVDRRRPEEAWLRFYFQFNFLNF